MFEARSTTAKIRFPVEFLAVVDEYAAAHGPAALCSGPQARHARLHVGKPTAAAVAAQRGVNPHRGPAWC